MKKLSLKENVNKFFKGLNYILSKKLAINIIIKMKTGE